MLEIRRYTVIFTIFICCNITLYYTYTYLIPIYLFFFIYTLAKIVFLSTTTKFMCNDIKIFIYQSPINGACCTTTLIFELLVVLPQQLAYKFSYSFLGGLLPTFSAINILILIDLFFLAVVFFTIWCRIYTM